MAVDKQRITMHYDDDKQPAFHLTYQQGKAIQEILNRYYNELSEQIGTSLASVGNGVIDLESVADLQKDQAYVLSLANLFD